MDPSLTKASVSPLLPVPPLVPWFLPLAIKTLGRPRRRASGVRYFIAWLPFLFFPKPGKLRHKPHPEVNLKQTRTPPLFSSCTPAVPGVWGHGVGGTADHLQTTSSKWEMWF